MLGTTENLEAVRLPNPTVAKRRGIRQVVPVCLRYLVLLALSVLFGAPFVWMLSSSFKLPMDMFTMPPQWIPHPFTLSNYHRLFTEMPFWSDAWHTVYIALFNVVGTVISCALVAYGFSRIQWPGRNAIFIIVVASLILPYQVVMIPQYLIFKHLGWLNSYRPLTIPALFGNAFFIFLLRQFMLGIPMELQDAAYIDGANEWKIFTRIILPLMKAALATCALFTFMSNWTDFLGPLIYVDNPNLQTLALGLQSFLGSHGNDEGALMAGTVLVSVPVIVVFFTAQKTFIEGITLSGTTK